MDATHQKETYKFMDVPPFSEGSKNSVAIYSFRCEPKLITYFFFKVSFNGFYRHLSYLLIFTLG